MSLVTMCSQVPFVLVAPITEVTFEGFDAHVHILMAHHDLLSRQPLVANMALQLSCPLISMHLRKMLVEEGLLLKVFAALTTWIHSAARGRPPHYCHYITTAHVLAHSWPNIFTRGWYVPFGMLEAIV